MRPTQPLHNSRSFLTEAPDSGRRKTFARYVAPKAGALRKRFWNGGITHLDLLTQYATNMAKTTTALLLLRVAKEN
jgi:hypothetical protein